MYRFAALIFICRHNVTLFCSASNDQLLQDQKVILRNRHLHVYMPNLSLAQDFAHSSFTLLYFTLLYFTLLYFTLLCFALLCFALLCFVLLYFTLLYFTLQAKTTTTTTHLEDSSLESSMHLVSEHIGAIRPESFINATGPFSPFLLLFGAFQSAYLRFADHE